MRHPTPEELKPLIQAIENAIWCLAVKEHTKKGHRCKVDWKQSLVELSEAYENFQIIVDDSIVTISD